jgi:hypothetical protein
MLKLSQGEVCFSSHCQKFSYDLSRSWCFLVSWLLGFRVWFWGCRIGGNLNFRRNRFVRVEASLDKDRPILKQVAIQPVSTPAINHQALFIYLPPFLSTIVEQKGQQKTIDNFFNENLIMAPYMTPSLITF